MDNSKIAQTFQEIGDLLEIDGANRFRVLAYQNAAETIRNYGMELKEIFLNQPENLKKIPGIGEDLRNKIEEMIQTGKCEFHQELINKYGSGILDILSIRGVGPKKAKLFYTELQIDNLEKLKKAAEEKQLQTLPRMGEKSETDILQAIKEHDTYHQRMLLSEALPLANKIIDFLKPLAVIEQISYAGSLRRGKETIGDLDILVSPFDINKAPEIILAFQKYPDISNVIADGPTKSAVILNNGVQVDLRVVEKKSFGAALHYFTGSKDHNVTIRDMAKKANLRINEYGIFKPRNLQGLTVEEMDLEYLEGTTEEKFYQVVGLKYIPPTLRENRGEFQASLNDELPILVEKNNLLGDLNIKSNFSSGKNSIEEIAKFFNSKKYSFIAINDILDSQEIRSNLTKEKALEQFNLIDQINQENLKTNHQFHIFKTLTINILENGDLDLDPEILEKCDFISIAINSHFNLPEPFQTARIIKAMQNPKVKMLCHPTSRILNQRPAINFNFTKILEAAIKNKVILEINSQPNRLDLPDNLIKLAKDKHALLSLNSSLENLSDFDLQTTYGLLTAQRGWLTKNDLINCNPEFKF